MRYWYKWIIQIILTYFLKYRLFFYLNHFTGNSCNTFVSQPLKNYENVPHLSWKREKTANARDINKDFYMCVFNKNEVTAYILFFLLFCISYFFNQRQLDNWEFFVVWGIGKGIDIYWVSTYFRTFYIHYLM